MHLAAFGAEPSAAKIVDAVRAAFYDEDRQGDRFFGLQATELCDVLASNEIVWAPDGDAAFDDGGHVLHFDQGDKVRLIAFKNVGNARDVISTLAEVWLDAGQFYHVLSEWEGLFQAEWMAARVRSRGN
jgi:hypothetical protein